MNVCAPDLLKCAPNSSDVVYNPTPSCCHSTPSHPIDAESDTDADADSKWSRSQIESLPAAMERAVTLSLLWISLDLILQVVNDALSRSVDGFYTREIQELVFVVRYVGNRGSF